MSRQLEQPQRVSKRRGVDHNVIVFVSLEQYLNHEQCGDFGHARQRGIEQRRNLLFAEERAALHNVENPCAVSRQKFSEFLLAVNLPDGKLPTHLAETRGAGTQLDLKGVRQGVRRIGGHEQNRMAGMAGGFVQRPSTGDRCLAHTALAHYERQSGHNRILQNRLHSPMAGHSKIHR